MWRGVLFGLASSQASCNLEDENALLQSRVKRLSDSGSTGGKGHPNALLESALSLAHSVAHENPETVVGLVDSMKAAIGQMKPTLETEHLSAQRQIDTQFDEVAACSGSSSHGTSIVEGFATQVAALAECASDQAAAASNQDIVCDAWSDHAEVARAAFPTLSNSPTPADILQHIRAWQSFAEEQLHGVEERNSACTSATVHASDQTSRCEELENEYDGAFCNHRQSCSLLQMCHRHEMSVYSSLIAESGDGMAARQSQWRTISQVECLLDHISAAVVSNTTIGDSTLSTCDDTVADDVLALEFPSPEEPASCPVAQAEDPHCPDVEIPVSWNAGSPTEGASLGSCEEEGWTYVVNYHDDRSLDDIPNDMQTIDAGFANSNAYYIGTEALQQLELGEVQVCALVKSTCQSTCYTVTSDDACGPCGDSEGLQGMISQLAGACASCREIIQNLHLDDFRCPGYMARGRRNIPYAGELNQGTSYTWHAAGHGLTLYAASEGYEFGFWNGYEGTDGNVPGSGSPGYCWPSDMVDYDTFQVRIRPAQADDR